MSNAIQDVMATWEILFFLFIYIYIYQVNKACEYPKNECSIYGYLIQNIPAEPNIHFCLKNNKYRNSIPTQFLNFLVF